VTGQVEQSTTTARSAHNALDFTVNHTNNGNQQQRETWASLLLLLPPPRFSEATTTKIVLVGLLGLIASMEIASGLLLCDDEYDQTIDGPEEEDDLG
jgi:hypothetical protein